MTSSCWRLFCCECCYPPACVCGIAWQVAPFNTTAMVSRIPWERTALVCKQGRLQGATHVDAQQSPSRPDSPVHILLESRYAAHLLSRPWGWAARTWPRWAQTACL